MTNPPGSRHGGAFGGTSKPLPLLREQLRALRTKCREEAFRLTRPYTGKPRTDRLRHLYAHVMQLDVVFQPIKGWFPVRESDGSIHHKLCKRGITNRCSCSRRKVNSFAWSSNPVWGKAPVGALEKARAFCQLLNVIVSHGYLCDISRDLERLAIIMWQQSLKTVKALMRRITAKIARAVRDCQFQKSPEPDERFSALTSNPANPCRVSWVRSTRRDRKSRKYVPRYVPPHRRSAIALA